MNKYINDRILLINLLINSNIVFNINIAKTYHSFLTVVVAVAVAFESAVSRLESCIVKSRVDHISSVSAVQRSNITLQIVNKTNSQINVILFYYFTLIDIIPATTTNSPSCEANTPWHRFANAS